MAVYSRKLGGVLGSYADVVRGDNPIAYWRLRETSGTTATDETGNGHTGTYVNGPSLSADGVTFTRASSQCATVSSLAGFPTTGAYTVEAWINPVTHTDGYGIFGYGNYGSTKQVNAIRLLNTTAIRVYWWGADLDVITGSLAGVWSHVVTTWDGTTRKLYVNGVLVGSDAPTLPNFQLSNCAIGRTWPAGSEFFDGQMRETAIYGSALSAAQVELHYVAGVIGTAGQSLNGSTAFARVIPILGWRLRKSRDRGWRYPRDGQ